MKISLHVALFFLLASFTLLNSALSTASADPYNITAWFEPANQTDEPSFNLRFEPFHKVLNVEDNIRIFFPTGTTLTVDGTQLKCTLHSNGNLRYYMQPQTRSSSKRAGWSITHADITFDGDWFNPDVHNLLIRCFGVTIKSEILEQHIANPETEANSVFLAFEKRQYFLKNIDDAFINGERY